MQLNYLESLVNDKNFLIHTLRGNGVLCLDSDTFTTLIPKINYIRGIEISDFTYLFAFNNNLNNKGLQYNCSLKPSIMFCAFYKSVQLTNDRFNNSKLFHNLDVTNCLNLKYLFYGCTGITEIDLSNWNFDSNKDYEANYMFANSGCKVLNIGDNIINLNDPTLIFAGVPITDIIANSGKIILSGNISEIFRYARYLTEIPKCIIFKDITNLIYTFYNCSALLTIDMTNWDVSKLKSIRQFADGCTKLQSVIMDNLHFDSLTSVSNAFNNCNSLTKISMRNVKLPVLTNVNSFFANASALTDLDLTGFDAPNITSFDYLFNNCYKLEIADLRILPLSQAQKARSMFVGCNSLKQIILNLNGECPVQGGETFDNSFYNLPNLEYVNTEEWDYDFKEVYEFFRNCPKITRLDLSNITISYSYNNNGITQNNSYRWFVDCPSLTFVDISKIDFTIADYPTQTWFGGTTPQNCEIIVKDEASKLALLAKKTTLTNVKTKEEYENEQ